MRFHHAIVITYCALLSAVILGPLLLPGYWLFNDAVSTPRIYPTPETYGVGDLAPRAVPQDWLLSLITRWIDGGLCVKFLSWAGIFLLGFSLALLAEYFLGKKLFPILSASTFAMANPYVNERLAQGQWSLLVGIGAGAMVMVITLLYLAQPIFFLHAPLWRKRELLQRNSTKSGLPSAGLIPEIKTSCTGISVFWPIVLILLSVANLTISSGIITVLMFLPLIGILVCNRVFSPQLDGGGNINNSRLIRVISVLMGFVLLFAWTALPWLWAGFLSGAKSSVSLLSAELFRFHNDPAGPLLTALSLGGIWNQHAWSVFRSNFVTAIMQSLFIVILLFIGYYAWLRRWKTVKNFASAEQGQYINQRIFILISSVMSVIAILAVTISANAHMTLDIFHLIQWIPGSGLWRDSQKFLAIAIPLYSLLIALAVERISMYYPGTAWLAWLCILVSFADVLGGELGTLRARQYPPDFTVVSDMINASPAPVISLPAGIVRQYSFMRFSRPSSSLDPFPRMLAAPVRTSGEINVDGHTIDRADSVGATLEQQILQAQTVTSLRNMHIGWIIVNKSPGNWGHFPIIARQLHPAYSGKFLELYRISPTEYKKSQSDLAQYAAINSVRPVYILWLSAMGIAFICLGYSGASFLYRKFFQKR